MAEADAPTPEDTTHDRFLGGALTIEQPRHGYRAGIDAVLLAAALPALDGARLIELGCGPGAALLCAARRLESCYFEGLEVDPAAAALARANAAANQFSDRVEIVEGDVAATGANSRAEHVFFNPPFFEDPSALRAPREEKTRAWMAGEARIDVWIDAAARRLSGRGGVTLIHRADKLGDILSAFGKRFGSIAVKPIQPRADKPAKRILVTARLHGRAPLKLLAPLVLHDGPEGYSETADRVLRGRSVIEMG